MKHTKRPWTVTLFDSVDALKHQYSTYHVNGGELLPREEIIANAHLIAAAPDMYNLLVRLTTLDGIDEYTKEVIRQAIAKAEGK